MFTVIELTAVCIGCAVFGFLLGQVVQIRVGLRRRFHVEQEK